MSNVAAFDQVFLRETLRLAKKGEGWTNPNPMVGAVIVKNGKVIARGYHQRAGLPHAEIEALRAATGTSVKGATIYVNLEPCCHFGKTPPCTKAILQAEIKRVVFATHDPNPKVAGKGARQLRQAGIKVSVGELAAEARRLNETFFTFHEKLRPFVVLRFAASLDGKIATRTGHSQWITNEQSRLFQRKLRAVYQAILVGSKTVLHDNPHLGVRIPGKRDPLRIILDSKLKIPLIAQVFRDSNALVVTTRAASEEKRKLLESKGITVLTFPGKKISIRRLMLELYQREIISMLVEGGGEVLGSFADEKLVDKVYAVHAPILIGGEKAVSALRGRGAPTVTEAIQLVNLSFKQFGDDLLTIGYRKT